MKKLILSLILVCSLVTSVFAVDPFASGVVGRWKLSENAGNTAGWLDLSANSNDLTGVGTPTSGSGFTSGLGDAVQLTGASSQKLNITFASATGLHDFASAFTFSAWINLDTAPSGDTTILGTWTQSISRSYVLVVNGGTNTIILYVSNDGVAFTSVASTSSAVVGTWMHIFAVWTGTQLEMYINNVSDATPVAFTAGIANFTNDWCIGSQNNCTQRYFDGRIDDVTVWNRVLTTDEKTYVYQLRGDFSTGSSGFNSINSNDVDNLTSLNSVTVTGVGAVNLLKGSRCNHSWATTFTGAPATATILLEGSVDGGANYFTLDTSTAITDNIRHITGTCVDTIRTNLTILTGGTSPTVTTNIESTQ